MVSEKQEDLLRISMQVTDDERVKSPDLDAGYLQDGKYVEIIVRFTGSIMYIQEKYQGARVYELLNNYGVIIAARNDIEDIIALENIQYAEKPKLLYFDLINSKRASCIASVQVKNDGAAGLFGEGVLVAVIDTGINPYLETFRDDSGNTRIINIWDQTKDIELSNQDINSYIANYEAGNVSSVEIANIPGFDVIGHGTNVAKIACGRDGVAPESEIIIVKMGNSGALGEYTFPRTTQLMRAVDYCVNKGIEYNKPVAINISFGNNYGDHRGESLLESYISSVATVGRNVICIGSGNEGVAATHNSGRLVDSEELEVELAVGEYESSLDIQIWKEFVDDFDVEIITPTGVNLGRINRYNQVNRTSVLGTEVLTYYGGPSPYSIGQEIYINLIPQQQYILSGVWRIRLIPRSIVSGKYDMWLPAVASINEGTGFLRPDENVTITIPATADGIVSVGAYDARSDVFATFSGVGYILSESEVQLVKPEIVAPGVDIVLGDGTSVTGTSFATPFVTGAAALLMEWGIVRKNDEFMYNEKVKAYLIKGARPLLGQNRPSNRTGWGALCLENSLSINS